MIRRSEKIEMLLKEQIAAIVDKELDVPEGGMVTITRVVLSSDKRYATAFFSVLGVKAKDIQAIAESRIFELQQIINKQMRIRPVPKIRFAIDEEEIRRELVERSLSQLPKEQ
jgi:ribosome-binding factor A